MTARSPGARLAWRLFATLLAVSWGSGCAPSGDAEGERTNLVVISLDTVRRDHLGVYGYDRPTSPFLDRFAERAAVFDWAFTQDTNTNPAHATVFTGLYPHQHGNEVNGHLLAGEHLTLAEHLAAEGYLTGAFLGGAPMKAEASRLDQGFERYDDDFEGRRRDGRTTVERALDWLAEAGAAEAGETSQPFFLFAHFWDAHGPYEPDPEELEPFDSPPSGVVLERIPPYQQLVQDGVEVRDLQHYVDRYDALIRRVDRLAERLIDSVPENTLIIVMADHGESLDERYHKLDHGAQVVDEQIRIPLLVAGPRVEPGRYQQFVSLVDLFPTVLELLGLTEPGMDLSGKSLAPGLQAGGTGGASGASPGDAAEVETIFAAARSDDARVADRGYELQRLRRVWGARDERWKLVVYPGVNGDLYELFDLENDPGELTNVFDDNRRTARNLLRAIEAWHPDHRRSVGTLEVSDALREQLRSLGYVE